MPPLLLSRRLPRKSADPRQQLPRGQVDQPRRAKRRARGDAARPSVADRPHDRGIRARPMRAHRGQHALGDLGRDDRQQLALVRDLEGAHAEQFARTKYFAAHRDRDLLDLGAGGGERVPAAGRHRHRPDARGEQPRRHVADDGREYALLNYLIQGSAAEILKMKLLELDAAGLGEYMILPVHDEVIFDVPIAEQEAAIKTIRDVMNDDTLCSVPITAGVARGLRWGEKEDIA